MAQWVMFSYPENTPDTKTQCVFVSGLNKSGEHGERNHWVVFSVSGSRGWGGYPRHKDVTTWSRSSRLGGRGWRITPDMKNATTGSCLHVWGISNIPDTKGTATWSHPLCLGGRGWMDRVEGHPRLENATLGSRSHVWDGRGWMEGWRVLATSLTQRT